MPRLHDLKTASTIGDSKAALQYLRGVLEPQLRRDSFHSHLLRRDNTTKDWEVRLAAYGHDIQRCVRKTNTAVVCRSAQD